MIRTYYWNTRKASLAKYYKNKITKPERMLFKHGNAGDIFNVDLIEYLYGSQPENIKDEGNRLLLVGSVMSVLKKGDIVNGIGWKGNDLENLRPELEQAKVYGVRGPLTLELFKKYGTDLSKLKFEYDPGLLIKEVYKVNIKKSKEKQVIFIPHYRDLWVYDSYPKGVKVVNIDNKPQTIINEILKSSVVYTSSLHGIIFSHALNKPCIFVAPQSDEPIFKYQDYYLSVGLEMPDPLKDIHALNYRTDAATVIKNNVGMEDFYFPSKEALNDLGIAT
jgi:pyruvyltransferase